MTLPTAHLRAVAVGVMCTAAGVGAGALATAAASPAHATSHTAAQAAAHHRRATGRHHARGVARRAVSGTVVVDTRSGYQPVTFERGVVDSVNGDQLALTEGSTKHPYKQVTVTVPASAAVRDNRAVSSLSSLTAGQRVSVVQLPSRTLVRAHTPGTHAAR